jgi:two-component system, NarL family, nitrate/nitrite response regulator NarL
LIRVWIENPSAVTRAGLESLLGGVRFVDSVADADVILREDLPETAPETHLPYVVLTDERPSARLLQWGVRAILPRDAEAAQILAAVYAAAAGLVSVPAESQAALASESVAEVEPLTPREMEVLEMLAEGLSNKQVAAKLNMSEHTAKFHVNSILGKLHAGTRTEAVMRGIRSGILKV